MSVELLPCPWCGGKASPDTYQRNGRYLVMCESCEAWPGAGDRLHEIDAIEDWNTRAPLDRDRSKYDELILAVHNKFPGESRHETALRYIREREAAKGSGTAQEGKET